MLYWYTSTNTDAASSSMHRIADLWGKLPSLLPPPAAPPPLHRAQMRLLEVLFRVCMRHGSRLLSCHSFTSIIVRILTQMRALEKVLFRVCMRHRSYLLRLRTLHTLACHELEGPSRTLSMKFVKALVLAMDDPAFLKFCGLNAANPAAPLGRYPVKSVSNSVKQLSKARKKSDSVKQGV